MGTFVVSGGDGLEPGQRALPFLASGIPDLELDAFVVDFELSDTEVHSDGRQEALVEHVVSETAQDVGLTSATVADDQNLEDVVVLLVHVFSNICNK